MLRGNRELAQADVKSLLKGLFRSLYEENRNIDWESDLWKKLSGIVEDCATRATQVVLVEFEEWPVPYIKGKIPKNSVNDLVPIFEDFAELTLLKGKLADKRVRLLKNGYARGITKINRSWAQECKKYFPNGRKRKTEI